MKNYICALAGVVLLTGCEQKETTVNPPAENKTENNTTVVKESPAKSETTINEKTTINASPSP